VRWQPRNLCLTAEAVAPLPLVVAVSTTGPVKESLEIGFEIGGVRFRAWGLGLGLWILGMGFWVWRSRLVVCGLELEFCGSGFWFDCHHFVFGV